MVKRSIPDDFNNQKIIKQIKQSEHHPPPPPPPPPPSPPSSAAAVFTDENLLFEVLKHADARTLGMAACVSKHWHRTAQDEWLWEMICTANFGPGADQLRIVVLALGGFRCLHSRYLLPLSKPPVKIETSSSSYTVAAATSTSTWPCLRQPPRTVVPENPAKTRWGKDEIQLSLSLLSYEMVDGVFYAVAMDGCLLGPAASKSYSTAIQWLLEKQE